MRPFSRPATVFAQTLTFMTAALLLMVPSSAFSQNRVPSAALGINLAGPVDWNTELPFVDVFRLSRQWISQRKGAGWGKGPQLQLDDAGWVTRLEPNCFAETPLCTIDGGHYPSGVWTIAWQGKGRIELSKGEVVSQSPSEMKVNIDSQGGGFFLRLLETDPQDPVRNIQVLMPGVTAVEAASQPWRKGFLELWQGVACIRFMDFQETNNSLQQSWADRPQVSDATYTASGVPIELMCDLANRLQCDAWFCMPHLADDDYVERFAQLVKQRLDSNHRVYIEYSNEVWNGQFAQHRYAADKGVELGLADKPWEAAWKYTARRSVEIFKIWQRHFDADQLVRVLPSQAANSYVAEQILKFENSASQADVLAIAPYISCNVPVNGDHLNVEIVSKWNLDQLFQYLRSAALPQSIEWIEKNRSVAGQHRLGLVGYEAGQHLVGVAGGENNESLTNLLKSANRDPRMQEIYRDYFDAWKRNQGGLLCYFSSVSSWSKWGSWGAMEYADSDPAKSPKYQALQEWMLKLKKK